MKTLHYPDLVEQFPVKITSCNDTYVSPHKHDFFELVYVCEGKAEHIFENKTAIIQQGDFFLINLNSSHEYRKIGTSGEFRVINCLFLPNLIDDTLKDSKSFQDILDQYLKRYGTEQIEQSPTQKIFHDESGFIGEIAQQMLREYTEKRIGYTDVIRNLLLTQIICLIRKDTDTLCDQSQRIVKTVKDFVAKNYAGSLHLTDICKKLNFSVPYVSMLFRKECGMTFRDYLVRVRIEKSCRLLRSTDMSIQSISQRVGYNDPAFFYKAFRRELSMTPDDYRSSIHSARGN